MDKFKKTSHAIILYDKKILMVLRDNKPGLSDSNVWTFPGGTMEIGENFMETLKRELKEEINIVPSNIEHVGLIINGETRSRHETYVCQLTAEEAGNVKLGNEGQDLKFFAYDEMVSLPHARYVEKFVSSYGSGLKKLIETGEVDKELLGFDDQDVLYV